MANEDLSKLFEKAADAAEGTRKIIHAGGGKEYLVLPEGFEPHLVDEFLAAPRELNVGLQMRTLESFIAYVDRHHAVDDTSIFADVTAPAVLAVIDYHGVDNAPTKRLHRASYRPVFSEEWLAWSGMNGKWTPQIEFVRFIEEHLLDIREPDGATVLELCQTLETNTEVFFKSAVRLDNNTVQLTYVENKESSAGGGKINIPTELRLGLPIFYGASKADLLRAFFRHNNRDGKLSFKIDLYRPRQALDLAFGEIVSTVREKLSKIPVYEASLSPT